MTAKDQIAILEEHMEALRESVKWLKRSYEICQKLNAPSEDDPEAMDAFESLTARFGRTTDILFNKVFKSIVFLKEQEYKSWLDMMFFLQKQGILEDVSNARYLKELRNDIVHEYQFSEISEMFEEVLRQTPHLLMLCDKGLEEGETLKKLL
jgi:hypothetical protein